MRPLPAVLSASLGALAATLALVVPSATAAPDASVFAGAGAWVDLYSPKALASPERAVAAMRARGVRTLYLETANWRQPRAVEVVRPALVNRFLDAAHARGVRVVAWYLAGFADLAADQRRVLAALLQTSPSGQQFDGFALDIEASLVRSVPARNAAMLRLSRWTRSVAGKQYPLAAIVPDARSTEPSRSLWPGFPYAAVGRVYDAFLPMAYSTYRARGATAVARYTRANVEKIQRLSGLGRAARVHVVGGIANGLSAAEARAVVVGARVAGALGASFYKYDLSAAAHWSALGPFVLAAPPSAAPIAPAVQPARTAARG